LKRRLLNSSSAVLKRYPALSKKLSMTPARKASSNSDTSELNQL